jgi:hypothetical protein
VKLPTPCEKFSENSEMHSVIFFNNQVKKIGNL